MPDVLRPTPSLTIPLGEVVVRASRSSGPGGQHANVTASRIEVSFDVNASESLSERQRGLLLSRVGPVVRAVAQDARSQARNRDLALSRLEERIGAALAVAPKRTATAPTRAARQRRLEAKRKRGANKALRRRPPDHD